MSLKSRAKHMLLGPPGERVRRIKGGLLRGHEFPIDTSNATLRLLGLWETEIASIVRRMIARSDVACDIGANTGWYASFFALQPHVKQVLAYEPDTMLLKQAETNARRLGASCVQKIQFRPAFVGNRREPQWCLLDDELQNVSERIALKIDVDGGELDVLLGARRTLETKPCELVIETHSKKLEADCIAFLADLAYETRVVKNAWYRVLVPEERNTEQNRWLWARRPES